MSLTFASNSANMRSIFDFSVVNAKIADRLADGAVCCEPFSASNSLITRENTGNLVDLSRFLQIQA